jgi:hypothetical protein
MIGLNGWIEVNDSFCSFDFSKLKILSKEESIDYTIENIQKNYSNLFLALSGGIDSEFAANCLLSSGVNFTPIIMDIKSNSIENWYAYKWCYENKKKPLVIEMTEFQIITSFPQIALKKNIPFYAVIPIVLSEIVYSKGGSLILGGEEIICRDYFLKNKSFEKMSENLETNKYAFSVELEDKGHVGGFLSYTPELFYNCLSELNYTLDGQLALCEYYGVLPRPKLNAKNNLISIPELLKVKEHSDKNIFSFCYNLGSKNSFLQYAQNKKKIKFPAIKINYG